VTLRDVEATKRRLLVDSPVRLVLVFGRLPGYSPIPNTPGMSESRKSISLRQMTIY